MQLGTLQLTGNYRRVTKLRPSDANRSSGRTQARPVVLQTCVSAERPTAPSSLAASREHYGGGVIAPCLKNFKA
jgi:hypothetical protein